MRFTGELGGVRVKGGGEGRNRGGGGGAPRVGVPIECLGGSGGGRGGEQLLSFTLYRRQLFRDVFPEHAIFALWPKTYCDVYLLLQEPARNKRGAIIRTYRLLVIIL